MGGQMSGGQSSRLHLRRRRGRLERWYLVKEDRSAVARRVYFGPYRNNPDNNGMDRIVTLPAGLGRRTL